MSDEDATPRRFAVGPVQVAVRSGGVVGVILTVGAGVVALLVWADWPRELAWVTVGMLTGVVVVLPVHELAHALAAFSVGVRPEGLALRTLSVGVVMPDELDRRPLRDQAWILVTGPLTNAGIAALCYATAMTVGQGPWGWLLLGVMTVAMMQLLIDGCPLGSTDMGRLRRVWRASRAAQ